jgi:hypothetical protein
MRTKKRPHRAEPPAGSQTPITSLINNGPTTTHLRRWLRKALREFEQGTQAEKYRSPRSKAWSRDKILAALKAESRHSRNTAPRDEVFSHESVAPIAVDKKGAKK